MSDIKVCQWLDSNHRPLASEATALTTEPQPLPIQQKVWISKELLHIVGNMATTSSMAVRWCEFDSWSWKETSSHKFVELSLKRQKLNKSPGMVHSKRCQIKDTSLMFFNVAGRQSCCIVVKLLPDEVINSKQTEIIMRACFTWPYWAAVFIFCSAMMFQGIRFFSIIRLKFIVQW